MSWPCWSGYLWKMITQPLTGLLYPVCVMHTQSGKQLQHTAIQLAFVAASMLVFQPLGVYCI